MESWRYVWREGFAPLLPAEALEALVKGLRENDPLLIQGQTTQPPPHPLCGEFAVQAGCVLCYALWRAGLAPTVGACEEAFARLCFEADLNLGDVGACRYFLAWYDGTRRDDMIRLLAPEVARALEARTATAV